MNNPNWNKETEMTAGRPQAGRAVEGHAAAPPVTEDELEAYRFRSTPLHRAAAPLAPQPLPAPHPGHGGNGRPGGHNDRIQAINEAVRQTSAWVAPLWQEISRVLVGQKNLVDRLLVGLVTNGHILLEGVPGLRQPRCNSLRATR